MRILLVEEDLAQLEPLHTALLPTRHILNGVEDEALSGLSTLMRSQRE